MTQDAFPVWVVYSHPSDHPDHIVVRRQWAWSIQWPNGRRVPALHFDAHPYLLPSLGVARGFLRTQGLTCIGRQPGDDPVIVETWI